jgi:hypothetical protein
MVKSGEGSHNAETTCHHDHQGIHPQIKGEILLQGNECTGYHQDDLLSPMDKSDNHL